MMTGTFAFCPSPTRLPYESLNSKISIHETKILGPPFNKPRVCLTSKKVDDTRLVLNAIWNND